MKQKISDSLYDLIEHVELNRSGWWDAALGNVILSIAWLEDGPVKRDDIEGLISSAYGLTIPSYRIRERVDSLVDQNDLAVDRDNQVSLSAAVADRLEARLKKAQANEDSVRTAFIDQVNEFCAPHSPEETWVLFNEEFLAPLIDTLGARTIQLIGGDEANSEDIAFMTENFLGHFQHQDGPHLRSKISDFLNPDDPNVQQYISSHLDASFLVKASGLTEEAIENISKFGTDPPSFHLILDTNVVFSILNLHENPSNEATQVLWDTMERVSHNLTINAQVINPTVDEFKRTLYAFQSQLTGMNMSSIVLDAAAQVGLSGIIQRFVQANRDAQISTNPQEYFHPYLQNLTPILRDKNVELNNEDTENLKWRRDVINDVLDMMDMKTISEAEKQRGYNAAQHDAILWHFVHDKRASKFESPLEANFWLVTNDYKLIAFDQRRRKTLGAAVGVCIHPAELLQILRLWQPRDAEVQHALTSVLRLPLLFHDFDPGEEAATVRIIKAISRFEYINDLSPTAIRDIVLSDAVRSKISTELSGDQEMTIVRDALLQEQSAIIERLGDVERQAKNRETNFVLELENNEIRIQEGAKQLENAKSLIQELETDIQRERTSQNAMNTRIDTLERQLNERDESAIESSERFRFFAIRGTLIVILAFVFIGLGFLWHGLGNSSLISIVMSCFGLWLFTTSFIVTIGIDKLSVNSWGAFRLIKRFQREFYSVVLMVIVGIISNALWSEVLRPMMTD